MTLALVKCIEIIGEAAAKVSAQTRASTPQIPWSDLPPLIVSLESVVASVDNA